MWATLEEEVKREWVEALGGIPKGSRNGYEFNKARHHLRLDRVPYSPLPYPADYGVILNTRAEDGDVLILTCEPPFLQEHAFA